MDLMALLQTKSKPKHVGVHNKVMEYGYDVGYLSKEPKCPPQVFCGSSPPSP